ncbi:hypothetical protein [Streptomyces capoamus]|uniref:hypothetical protein n=1 Tax=Streptomyces capoamus TaxID=68183 RepID=UPI001E586DB7|nr:hypothetical protein [Streptomyces capoamus]
MTTGMLGWLGYEDVVTALRFTGRLTGAVLVAVAFTTLLGAVAAADHWLSGKYDSSGVIALIGTFAAALTNLFVWAEILKNGDYWYFQVLFGLLTVGSVWAAFTVYRTLDQIPAPKRVAATLVVTTVIAVANFGYQNLYQPSQRETLPVIRLDVGKAMQNRGGRSFSVPVDIEIENRGDAAFYVLATEFHAMAEQVRLSRKDRSTRDWRADAERWKDFRAYNPVSRREIHQPGVLVSAQPWMPYGRWIYAKDMFSARVVVQLPKKNRYDQLTFYAGAHLTRKDLSSVDRLKASGSSWENKSRVAAWVKKQKDFSSLAYESRIRENNSIDARTRKARYITVYWQFGQHGVNLLETINTSGGKDESQDVVENRYGVRQVYTGPVTTTLWDVKNQH